MAEPPPLLDDLARLKRERDEADRRYNDALSQFDRSVLRRLPEIPHPPPPFDEYQITPLNELWRVVPEEGPPLGSGWRARLRGFVWRFVGPLLQQQQQFNAALVDHVNRNIAISREATRALESVSALLREQLAALVTFESQLAYWAQQITLYVDTKDRDVVGELRTGLTAAINELRFLTTTGLEAITDELQKKWESMVARERRYEGRLAELRAAYEAHAEHLRATYETHTGELHSTYQTRVDELQASYLTRTDELRGHVDELRTIYEARTDELRTTLAVFQRTSAALKRELERLLAAQAAAPAATPRPPAATAPAPGAQASGPAMEGPARAQPFGAVLDAYKYVGFEDKFRGSEEEIRERMTAYLPDFEGASDVLDVGCGRGEFLDLLRGQGIRARGVDVNHEMVEVCRARDLDVAEGDALEYLEGLPDGSLGGLFAAQVVEHLDPGYLLRFLETAYHKLRPGSKIILETINTTCWYAFFESYIRDITHVRPLHPDTLSYLLTASGFQRTSIRYSMPLPESARLQPIAIPDLAAGGPGSDELAQVVATFNENIRRLNNLLFTHLDYAAIGERL